MSIQETHEVGVASMSLKVAQHRTNATVSNNDIATCGDSGTKSAGQGLWADGISFACTNFLVKGNDVSDIFPSQNFPFLIVFAPKITGSTDGGIVIFGAPGTTVTGNTITSSSTYVGFGAINMVDGTYDGKFTNV
jgi:hypothetical protein